jgi:uncharacterized protein YdeI (BOF family)
LIKKFLYLFTLFLFIFFGTYFLYKKIFYDPKILINREDTQIQTKENSKKSLPVIDKQNIYSISQIKELPKNSIVLITGKIVELKKEKDIYTGKIKDPTGEISFFMKKRVIENNKDLKELFEDVIFLDIQMKFVVKVHKNKIELLEIW